LASEYLTVVRWRANNPRGSPVHYGVVLYGTRPDRLIEAAESPVRLSPDHQTTLFRVRIGNLKQRTTYYYRVDSIAANGNDDRATSSIKTFSIP
jgi:hypothetical protein